MTQWSLEPLTFPFDEKEGELLDFLWVRDAHVRAQLLQHLHSHLGTIRLSEEWSGAPGHSWEAPWPAHTHSESLDVGLVGGAARQVDNQ